MIPRIIHAWWGGPEMPPHLAGYLDRWRELHPEWEVRLWTPETTPHLGDHQELYDRPELYSPASNRWQWRSDLARYRILHDIGGVYVDCDLEPLRPIDELLDCDAFAAREDGRFINNAFIGCPPGAPFMTDVLSGLRRSVERQPRSRANRQVGAYYLTSVAERHPELRVLPREQVYPYGWWELDAAERPVQPTAYTRHHWHNKRTQLEVS